MKFTISFQSPIKVEKEDRDASTTGLARTIANVEIENQGGKFAVAAKATKRRFAASLASIAKSLTEEEEA